MKSRAPNSSRGRPSRSCFDTALNLLARRAHSAAELRLKLARRGYGDDELSGTMERMRSLGYLDDDAFADGLVRRRGADRSRLWISRELAARGVDRETVARALACVDSETELEAARREVARSLRAGQRNYDYRKVAGRLLRRGFAASTVRAALRSATRT